MGEYLQLSPTLFVVSGSLCEDFETSGHLRGVVGVHRGRIATRAQYGTAAALELATDPAPALRTHRTVATKLAELMEEAGPSWCFQAVVEQGQQLSLFQVEPYH